MTSNPERLRELAIIVDSNLSRAHQLDVVAGAVARRIQRLTELHDQTTREASACRSRAIDAVVEGAVLRLPDTPADLEEAS